MDDIPRIKYKICLKPTDKVSKLRFYKFPYQKLKRIFVYTIKDIYDIGVGSILSTGVFTVREIEQLDHYLRLESFPHIPGMGPYLEPPRYNRPITREELFDLSLDRLCMSTRAHSGLRKNNITKLGQLRDYTTEQLSELPYLGENTAKEIDELKEFYDL